MVGGLTIVSATPNSKLTTEFGNQMFNNDTDLQDSLDGGLLLVV